MLRTWGIFASGALLGAACGGVPLWPVGVPPAANDQGAERVDAALPFCAGQPDCEDLGRLRRLLDAQAARCSGPGDSRPVSPEVEALLKALAISPSPVSSGFPGSFAAAPAAFREALAQPVVDARQENLDVSAAVLFHGVWWSFWDRGAISENPTAKSGSFTTLTVFPEFQGREPCKEW